MNTRELIDAIYLDNELKAIEIIKRRPALVNVSFSDSGSPLMMAARAGLSTVVKQLIESKAAIDYQNSWGQTALYHAATGASSEIVEQLLEAKATFIRSFPSSYTIGSELDHAIAIVNSDNLQLLSTVDVLFRYGNAPEFVKTCYNYLKNSDQADPRVYRSLTMLYEQQKKHHEKKEKEYFDPIVFKELSAYWLDYRCVVMSIQLSSNYFLPYVPKSVAEVIYYYDDASDRLTFFSKNKEKVTPTDIQKMAVGWIRCEAS